MLRILKLQPRLVYVILPIACLTTVGQILGLAGLQNLATALVATVMLMGLAAWMVLGGEFTKWIYSPIREDKSRG